MTDAQTPATPSIPAGWYPDPSNAAQQRWWDGTQWSEQVSAPYVAAAQQKAPDGTNVQTPWIWLNVLLPLLGLVPLFFIDTQSIIRTAMADPTDPSAAMQAQFAFMFQPAILAAYAISFLVMALTILFAFLDWRELKRRGVPAPFQWAFSFLALAGFGIVYPIGRSVVVKRRTGVSDRVLLVAILTIVLSFVVAIFWTVLFINQMMGAIGDLPGMR
jgi:Protein of unknown function (DUF2510)